MIALFVDALNLLVPVSLRNRRWAREINIRGVDGEAVGTQV